MEHLFSFVLSPQLDGCIATRMVPTDLGQHWGHNPLRTKSCPQDTPDGHRDAQRQATQLALQVFLMNAAFTLKCRQTVVNGGAEWRYVVSKTNTPHIVPLSRQAIEILRELQPLTL